jgi:hypothetical protein
LDSIFAASFAAFFGITIVAQRRMRQLSTNSIQQTCWIPTLQKR